MRGAPGGEIDCYDNEIPRLRCAAFRMTCGGSADAGGCGGRVGDGSPHSRGQRRGGRPRGTPLRRCRGTNGFRDGGKIPRLRFAAFGMTCGGEAGMGPRIREDNGGEGAHKGRPYGDAGGRGWVPGWGRDPSASLRCTRNDVSGRVEGRAVREPHLRLVINVGFDGAKLVYFRSHEVLVGGRGWVPAFARTTEGRAPTRDAPTEMPG